MKKYPTHYPTEPGFNPHTPASWVWAWQEPAEGTSHAVAKMLKSAAGSIRHEGGLCQQVFACHEAAHRLTETLRILKTDAPASVQLNRIQKLHIGGELDDWQNTPAHPPQAG